MSMGYGASAILIAADDCCYMYAYGSINLNQYEEEPIRDGIIIIDKSCFIEPEIRRKTKHCPHGKKELIENKIMKPISFDEYWDSRKVLIENCSRPLRLYDGVDVMARELVMKMFKEYMQTGKIEKMVGIFY